MQTFAISTLGCKVNAYESQGYIEGLKQLGYEEVDFKEKADIYIINTCAVTNTAASKSKQKIHQAKRLNQEAIVCVVGCLIQTTKEDLNVDILIGSSNKMLLPSLVKSCLERKGKYNYVEDMSMVHTFENIPIHFFENHTRAYLKIQDGCNQFCSYCIIPYARGRERSLSMEEVIETAKILIKNHHKEIVLSGIHTGRYGKDINSSLTTLIKQLIKLEGLERIRISSIEMNEVSDELLTMMSESSKIANHLHIPIQSACDRTLKMMNRPYDVDTFKKKIHSIREKLPHVSISTDIILGFPDEREVDFKETIFNLTAIDFSFIHIFPFSKRDGTKACDIPNHLVNKEKKKRCQITSLLAEKHYNEYKRSFIGQEVDVLFEYEKEGYLFGHSSEYIEVMAKLNTAFINKISKVTITRLSDGKLYND